MHPSPDPVQRRPRTGGAGSFDRHENGGCGSPRLFGETKARSGCRRRRPMQACVPGRADLEVEISHHRHPGQRSGPRALRARPACLPASSRRPGRRSRCRNTRRGRIDSLVSARTLRIMARPGLVPRRARQAHSPQLRSARPAGSHMIPPPVSLSLGRVSSRHDPCRAKSPDRRTNQRVGGAGRPPLKHWRDQVPALKAPWLREGPAAGVQTAMKKYLRVTRSWAVAQGNRSRFAQGEMPFEVG